MEKFTLTHYSPTRGNRTLTFRADANTALDIIEQYVGVHRYDGHELILWRGRKVVIEATSIMGAYAGLRRVFAAQIEERNAI